MHLFDCRGVEPLCARAGAVFTMFFYYWGTSPQISLDRRTCVLSLLGASRSALFLLSCALTVVSACLHCLQ